jgi:hypothetical protein
VLLANTILTVHGHGIAWFFGALLAVAAFIGAILMILGGVYLASLVVDHLLERTARSFKLHRAFAEFVIGCKTGVTQLKRARALVCELRDTIARIDGRVGHMMTDSEKRLIDRADQFLSESSTESATR